MSELPSKITQEEMENIHLFFNKLTSSFPQENSALIPILQDAQRTIGYLPREVMEGIAAFLGIPRIDVYGVATFYNQFRLNPPGNRSIRVCMGTACHIGGGNIILDAWKRRLGIDRQQTTSDREFDLDTVACVGCCAMAPVVSINDEVHGRVSPTRIDGLLMQFQIEQKTKAKENQ